MGDVETSLFKLDVVVKKSLEYENTWEIYEQTKNG